MSEQNGPEQPDDPLTLPNGYRLTQDDMRRSLYSFPPLVHLGAPAPVLSQVRDVRMFPVLDASGLCIAEVTFTWKDGAWYFGRSPFVNSFEARLNLDDAGRLALAAEARDWETVDRLDPEALPWFCRKCAVNYAESAWKVFPRFDEEDGWPDSYRGICPDGHERMIAD